MRICWLAIAIAVIGIAVAAQEKYAFPGKFIFAPKENTDIMKVDAQYLRQFKEKVEEIFISKRVFRIFNPERMSNPLDSLHLTNQQSRPTHVIFYWLRLDYEELATGGAFFLEGELCIEKIKGQKLAGLIWKRASSRLHSRENLGIVVSGRDDDRQRRRCIDELAGKVAGKMIEQFTLGEVLAPSLSDKYLSARLCQESFRPGDCISVNFSWSREAPGAWYLYILYFQHSGTIDLLLPNSRIDKFIVDPGSAYSWPGTTGRRVSRNQAIQARARWGVSRIIAEKYTAEKHNERVLILISAKPVLLLEGGLASTLRSKGKMLSLSHADLKKLRQQLSGQQYASVLLDILQAK